MQNNFITTLLDLKDIKVTKFRNRKNRIRIHKEKLSTKNIAKLANVSTTTVSKLLSILAVNNTFAGTTPQLLTKSPL